MINSGQGQGQGQYNYVKSSPKDFDKKGFESRNKGLSIKDCILTLEPSLESKLALLTMGEREASFVEGVVRGGGGGGALDIDAARIDLGLNDPNYRPNSSDYNFADQVEQKVYGKWGYNSDVKTQDFGNHNSQGRFPTNLILKHGKGCECVGTKKVKNNNNRNVEDGSIQNTKARSWKNSSIAGIARIGYGSEDGKEEVLDRDCEPSCPVGVMDRQSGHLLGQGTMKKQITKGKSTFLDFHQKQRNDTFYGDSGGASRYFKQVQTEEELDHYLKSLIRNK